MLYFLFSLILLNSSLFANDEFEQFRKAVLSNNRAHVANMIKYPLKRSPQVILHSAKEFLAYYDYLIDENLKIRLEKYNLKTDQIINNWAGRGVMSGDFWFDHGLIAFNYHSEKEKRHLTAIASETKKKRHPSLNGFGEVTYECKTDSHQIQIYQNAVGKVQYVAWNKGIKLTDKPSLILKYGSYQVLGTARNEYYKFINGRYTYMVNDISVPGQNELSGAFLTVYFTDKKILHKPCLNLSKL